MALDTTTDDAQPNGLWTVSYQRETSQSSAGGTFQNGVLVGFTTKSGAQLTAFFPYISYNRKEVVEKINALAAKAEEIGGLGQ